MRPVELITSNVLHEMADKLQKLPLPVVEAATQETIMDAIARDLLCNISHSARLDLVMKAIAAAGGPADAGELSARFKAVRDMHAQK